MGLKWKLGIGPNKLFPYKTTFSNNKPTCKEQQTGTILCLKILWWRSCSNVNSPPPHHPPKKTIMSFIQTKFVCNNKSGHESQAIYFFSSYWIGFRMIWRIRQIQADNTLRDLHNSSDHTQPHSKIAKPVSQSVSKKKKMKLTLLILWVRLTFNNVFNKMNFKLNDFLTLPWQMIYTTFSLDKIREQMRSEMENISEKIAEEGGEFRMLIPNTVTRTPFLLICIAIKFHSISFY